MAADGKLSGKVAVVTGASSGIGAASAKLFAEAGARVLYDDRAGVSPPVKFKDAELIGVPTVVVVGKGLADGVIEVRDRRSSTIDLIPSDAAARHLIEVSSVSTRSA